MKARAAALFMGPAGAAGPVSAAATPAGISGEGAGVNMVAAVTFLLFIGVTLAITWWAARHTRSTADFYAASSRITGIQNGLAIAGDFLSAATFLGITGLVFVSGFDAIIYVLSALVGLTLMLILMAEPFRHLGRYTLSDVAAYRLDPRPVRAFSAVTSLLIVVFYLVAQMVGAGALIQLLFGLPYAWAVVIIGVLMTVYVSLGGMLGTTWVQIIKALLMLLGIAVLAAVTLSQFDFDIFRMYSEAAQNHQLGNRIFAPGGMLEDPISTISLALALVFGFVGLPHVLMRLFTVPDAKAAYRSVFYSGLIISFISALVFFVIGFGAIAVLHRHPELFGPDGGIIGGSNMVAIHLARVVAGDVFLGFISASVFATILAVVAGLTLAGASALSHDLYANVLRHGRATESEELRVTRWATLLLGFVATLAGIVFENQNIAYMASMAFAISASANFPLLFCAVYWNGLTSRGAVIGGLAGLISAVLLMVLGPTIWVEILGHSEPVFPWKYPALFSAPLGLLVMWVASTLDHSVEGEANRRSFDPMFMDMQRGTAAAGRRRPAGAP